MAQHPGLVESANRVIEHVLPASFGVHTDSKNMPQLVSLCTEEGCAEQDPHLDVVPTQTAEFIAACIKQKRHCPLPGSVLFPATKEGRNLRVWSDSPLEMKKENYRWV